MSTVLIAGASGLVGTAAALAFAEAGWQVITLSRRTPELLQGHDYSHVALDLQDPNACRDAAKGLSEVSHVVYAAVYEMPGLIAGWSDPQQIETNGRMLRNLIGPLCATGSLSHITILQGTKAYGGHVQRMRIPARESHARVEHPNFYWLQEDYIREQASRHGFGYTIFRPQLIVGPNHGVVMNPIPVIGIYAAIRRAQGLPFSFPGGVGWVWEAVDTRLIANACVWATSAHQARDETFNLTNGEVFAWRDMWPAMAEVLGVDLGDDEPLSLATYLPAHAHVWDEIVVRHGLQANLLDDLLGESHHYADLCLAYGASTQPAATYLSTVKIKQAGFTETYDTEASVCYWLEDLMRRKILPGPLTRTPESIS